jgi:hypothetical protein
MQGEKEAASGRLARILSGSLPVIEKEEARA